MQARSLSPRSVLRCVAAGNASGHFSSLMFFKKIEEGFVVFVLPKVVFEGPSAVAQDEGAIVGKAVGAQLFAGFDHE